MVDVPGDTSTTSSVTVGSTTSGTLESLGDHDWYRITLTAGQSISVTINGVTLEDPYLYIRDSSGNLLYQNDDISSGVNRNSRISFTATETGDYYIDVGAWDEAYTGDYQITVSVYTPPPVATVDQFADQLINGYWGGESQAHHFNVTQGGTITVNLTALTSAGQTLARAALAQWTEIIGVTFQEVTTGGQITFDDNESGAFTESDWSFGITTSAHVNVSTQWLANYGTGLNSYSFQTYLHEIGHALGLGHAGNYNGDATYPYDAEFQNDAWAMSVMSYFSQTENSYFAGQGFTEAFITTPMMADIAAMQQLYGLSTTTRVGDTTYGPSWTAATGALCIFDTGGNDTIDVSAYAGNQRIDLNPGTFSNVLGKVGNVSIALSVIIENARAGSGNDTLIGNSVANLLEGGAGSDSVTGNAGDDILTGGLGVDSLSGGSGNDLFRDSKAGLNGDTIADFGLGDSIVITDASLAGFSFSLSGNILSYTGGSLTLGSVPAGTIVASAAAGGGVELRLGQRDAASDFNGDGRSDLLLRNDNGWLAEWLGQANGSFAANAAAGSWVHPDWQVAGAGDFNADGRDDLLLRHSDGTMAEWLGQANGSFAANNSATSWLHPAWQIAGTGDFNGDGRDDLLLRHSDGTMAEWLGQANGSFAANNGATSWLHPDWHVEEAGDFNGDGRDDVLLRHEDGTVVEWLGQANGSFAANASATSWLHPDWHVAGAGDFNGDGRDDVLLRHEDGTVVEWLGQANGSFAGNAAATSWVHPDWQVEEIGDFNADGRDDLLLRHTTGTLAQWFAQTNGSFSSSGAATYGLDAGWHPQPDLDWLV